jgi:acetyl-CoA C-acetyltransferase
VSTVNVTSQFMARVLRASGLLRFAEAAVQVTGRAGAHQVHGARTALGHAYGGRSQLFSMWVVSSVRC